MVTKFDVGDTILFPMEVTKITATKKSLGIIYRLECKAMNSNMQPEDVTFFANESDINCKLELNDVPSDDSSDVIESGDES